MDTSYLERAAQDLYTRASTIVVNNAQTISVKSARRTGNSVVIVAEPVRGITKITSLRLLDELGSLITERRANLNVTDKQALEFTFSFEVKGGSIGGV